MPIFSAGFLGALRTHFHNNSKFYLILLALIPHGLMLSLLMENHQVRQVADQLPYTQKEVRQLEKKVGDEQKKVAEFERQKDDHVTRGQNSGRQAAIHQYKTDSLSLRANESFTHSVWASATDEQLTRFLANYRPRPTPVYLPADTSAAGLRP